MERNAIRAMVASALVMGFGGGCASTPAGGAAKEPRSEAAGAVGRDDGEEQERDETGLSGDALPVDDAAAAQSEDAPPEGVRVYAGFLPETFATEPLALLPPTRVTLPHALLKGPEGEALRQEVARLVTDRLPEEIRIVHSRAPLYAYRDWAAGEEDGPRGGFVRSLLGWSGPPGPDGQLPALVGDSVEELGDSRGIRYFLFPRSLDVRSDGTFDYSATLEAYLLDARGERVVWAGEGRAGGTLPEGDPGSLLTGVVLDAVARAVSDLAAKLPGSASAGGEGGFTDGQQ